MHISKEHLDAERQHIAERKQQAHENLGPLYPLIEAMAFDFCSSLLDKLETEALQREIEAKSAGETD